MAKRIIAVDLDGTLAEYHGWKGVRHIGNPIPAMVSAVKQAQKEGADIWIHTARVSTDEDSNEASFYIREWLTQNDIEFEGITATKHKFFTEFWDDRAIQVIRNTGEMVVSPDAYDDALDNFGFKATSEDTIEGTYQLGNIHDAIDMRMNEHQLSQEQLFTPAIQTAMDSQVGGNHYSKLMIQPAEYAMLNNLGPAEAMIIKYITRHPDKGGKQDLEKAKHLIDMIIEHKYEGNFHTSLLKRLQVISKD